MTPVRRLREGAPIDLAKRDLTLTLGGRTFAIRAYQDASAPAGPGWHTVIVENRTPLHHGLAPARGPASCLAAAARFLTAVVVADAVAAEAAARGTERDRRREEAWESEGGAPAWDRDGSLAADGMLSRRAIRGTAVPPGTERRIAP